MTEAPTLPCATPRRPLFPRYYFIFLASVLIPSLCLIVLFTFFVPRFTAIFNQFGGKVPAITQCILSVSYFIQHYFLLFFPLSLILLGAFPLLPAHLCTRCEDPRRRSTIATLLILLHMLAFLFVLVLIFVAVVLPVFDLQQLVR